MSSSTTPPLSRAGSLYLKRGASIQALEVQDPTTLTKGGISPLPAESAASSTGTAAEPTGKESAKESEGGQLVDAFADFKQQTWVTPVSTPTTAAPPAAAAVHQ